MLNIEEYHLLQIATFKLMIYFQNKDEKLFFEFVPEGDLFLFNISSFQSFVSFVIK